MGSLVQYPHNRAMSVSPAILCLVCLATTVFCAPYGEDPFSPDYEFSLAEFPELSLADDVNTMDPPDVKVYTTEKMLERHDNGGLNIPHSYKGVVVANIKAHEKGSKPYPVAPTEHLLNSLRAKAGMMRANTIVGLKFETIQPQHGVALLVAYGTAVNI